MKKILLSFADEKYRSQQNILHLSSKLYFNEIINVSPEDIEEDFIKENQDIFNSSRGYGYWIWKSYFIRRVLEYINEGDILFYIDSGNEIINDPQSLFNLLQNQDIILFKNRDGNPSGDVWKNSTWTKADCFNLMECNSEIYKNGDQVDGSYILLKKTSQSIQFIDEYLKYSCDKNIITDLPNITGDNESNFIEHRHDQSILSLLAIKHNIETCESPSESSNHIKKDYPQIFNHFRRNIEWSQIVRSIYSSCFIYSHMGLGDHIILNGLIRSIIQPDINYIMFVKKIYQTSVEFMYNDLKNLKFISVEDDNEVNYWLELFQIKNIIKIGFENLNINIKDQYFDKAFYSQFNLPIETKWEKFYVERNLDREKELFDSLNLKKDEYIFLHEDISRNFKINRDLIQNKHLPIISPHQTDNIFDWYTVIENASEIHCICSSFKHLADSLELKSNKLYYHISYTNNGQPRNLTISYNKNNWKNI
jgi:hypothetical protein